MPDIEPAIAQSDAARPNGGSTPHDLFALTDEQILEIEPEAQDTNVSGDSRSASDEFNVVPGLSPASGSNKTLAENAALKGGATQTPSPATQHGSRGADHAALPPAWLAEAMNDPQRGGEARALWEGAQKTEREAAAYREVFSTPEDARALKALYPGGVSEARATAERARVLDEIDHAYFGAAGGTPEQTTAARAQLAAAMLREDPAAFREMVFAGLRALEELEKGSGVAPGAGNLPRLAQVFATSHNELNVAPRFSGTSAAGSSSQTLADAGLQSGATSLAEAPAVAGAPTSTTPVGATLGSPALNAGNTSAAESQAYAAFEKAANEELERTVGAAISRTIEQALPVAQPLLAVRRNDGTQARVPALQERLGAAIRQDVESALKGDRQLGEQIAQILSARRFDNETRAQVVRLIDDRAQQLVPGAARHVINDWTQATLSAHRGNAARADAAAARREVAPASSEPRGASSPARPAGGQASPSRSPQPHSRPESGAPRQRVDYRKLSDEQILEL